ncbi:ricin-type beta-trefoil lectin domain protein [Couchioplanes caeruleus]|uniref:RICIN domain-containing protein n=1 Tax=Couchioplanes caeruleus TaxID=56438 RepID=UPI0020BFFB68|nr:RICIN domain-containing protein [Couchioplanes caeruleus]UQU62269.1 ricin-type beta-trefoil lectin domain protein [Couchioplanes caeruleus]
MADEDDELQRQDPVLVRPYIRTEPGSTEPAAPVDRPEETWPETAMLPDEDPAPEEPAAAPAAAPPPPGRGISPMRQRLIVLGGVFVLALVAAAFVLLGTGGDDEPPLPETQATLPAPGVTGSLGNAPASQRASASAGRTPRPSGTASARTESSSRPDAVPPAATVSTPTSAAAPSATLAPPPAADRTGAVTAAGGRCLALGGLLGLDGSPVQVSGCSGVSYQSFTLATDGTLRVAGRCAQVTADAEVRTVRCDDRESAQWRAGPDSSLVNPATGQCLTDPGSAGGTATVSPCTGAASQSWTLP